MFLSKKLLLQTQRTYVGLKYKGSGSSVTTTEIYTSTDLENWSLLTTVQGNAGWLKQVNGLYFLIFPALPSVLNNGNQIAYSDDCVHWTSVGISDSSAWRDLAYGNGTYVLTGVPLTNTTLYLKYSNNLTNWYNGTQSTSGGFKITYGNGLFTQIALQNSAGGYSSDGQSFTSTTIYAGAYMRGIEYDNNNNCLVTLESAISTTGQTNTQTNLCLRSVNGTSFTTYELPMYGNWRGCAFIKGNFVLMRSGTYGAYEDYCYGNFTDGFKIGKLPSNRRWGGDITCANGWITTVQQISNPTSTVIAISKDGINWEEKTATGIILSSVIVLK